MMRTDAGFHADQARRHVGKPRFHLAALPPLPKRYRTALIETYDVEKVLADIDVGDGDCGVEFLGHSVPRFWRLLPT